MNGPIRVIELFSGVGSQHQALKNLGIPYEIVGISEIDKYAIMAYTAIHGPVKNLGDITKIEHLPPCDLITYSFPCQDLSIIGLKNGMIEKSGTRSSLLWDVGRLLMDLKNNDVLPEYLLMENVDAILNKRNIDQFQKWIIYLNEMGYNSTYKVINAINHDIPQYRKRCFMISTLTKGILKFPPDRLPTLKLSDILQEKVDKKYFLSDEKIRYYCGLNDKGGRPYFRPIDKNSKNAHTITTRKDRATCNFLLLDKNNIRYFTEKECFRLMGFKDSDIDKITAAVNRPYQCYKLAGNSIVVNCLEDIFKSMFIEKIYEKPKPKQTRLFT